MTVDSGVSARGERAGDDQWSDAELRAAVEAYRRMYVTERAAKHVVKRAVVDDLRAGPLHARSAGSVSRRMHNISAVLDDLGMDRMRGYAPLTHVGSRVRARLERIIEEMWGVDAPPPIPVLPYEVVPVGVIRQEEFAMAGVPPRVAQRLEQALVCRYVAVAAANGRSVVAHAYRGGLRCDAYDETRDVLIEAKASSRREAARMALGQLFDYRRMEPGSPTLAVLFPAAPARPTADYLVENRVEIIWETRPGTFRDTSGGSLC